MAYNDIIKEEKTEEFKGYKDLDPTAVIEEAKFKGYNDDFNPTAAAEKINNAHTKINSNRFLSAQGLADDIKPGKDNDKSFEK